MAQFCLNCHLLGMWILLLVRCMVWTRDLMNMFGLLLRCLTLETNLALSLVSHCVVVICDVKINYVFSFYVNLQKIKHIGMDPPFHNFHYGVFFMKNQQYIVFIARESRLVLQHVWLTFITFSQKMCWCFMLTFILVCTIIQLQREIIGNLWRLWKSWLQMRWCECPTPKFPQFN